MHDKAQEPLIYSVKPQRRLINEIENAVLYPTVKENSLAPELRLLATNSLPKKYAEISSGSCLFLHLPSTRKKNYSVCS